jgi:hypothetical protein
MPLARKRGHEEDEEIKDDDEMDDEKTVEDDDEDDEDDEDIIDLDKAEEEEDDDDVDDDDDEDEEKDKSVEQVERQKLFQAEAEDVLESLTMDDVREVLKENDMEVTLASKLKKLLVEVINEGEVVSMDEAWDEAIERLEE